MPKVARHQDVTYTPPGFVAPTYDEFERRVFDTAIIFAVGSSRGRGSVSRTVATDLAAAMKLTEADDRACLYVANAQGRQIVLDRKDWGTWKERDMFNQVRRKGEPNVTYLISWTDFVDNVEVLKFQDRQQADIYAYENLAVHRTAKIVADETSLADRTSFSTAILIKLYNALGPERPVSKFETRAIAENRVFTLLFGKYNYLPMTEVHEDDPSVVSLPLHKKEDTMNDKTSTTSVPAKRGRKSSFAGDSTIKVLVKENPKRPSSTSHARFELYRNGMTVDQFLAAGGVTGDLAWDSQEKHKFIEVVPAHAG